MVGRVIIPLKSVDGCPVGVILLDVIVPSNTRSSKWSLCLRKTIKVGMLIVKSSPDFVRETGYERAAGAIPLAVDAMRRDHLVDDYNFSFYVKFSECNERLSAGSAVSLIRDDKVDVIFGPTCSTPAITVGTIAAYYNTPIYLWGLVTSHQLADSVKFPTATRMSADSADLAEAFLAFMKHHNYDQFAFVYMITAQEKCKYIESTS
uniref:ANF_receptor domain-containing protein n=1 Tax=Steinernema glaseri TaxID=37863 RepID=A0A1I7XYJ3_9BILA